MNEAMAVFLNLDERKSEENEDLIRRIDGLLLNVGIEYTGALNMYRPSEQADRDGAVFAACRALKETDWLKEALAYTSVMNRTDVCPIEKIQPDSMTKPSAAKLKYYEDYYQASGSLAHGIVVDENGMLRDGYFSYILARKYGLRPDIYEAFAKQPLVKVVRGRHVRRDEDTWKIKSNKCYSWNYTLRAPVVPGDILKAHTKKGHAFICVDRIDYVTGKEFCEEHRKIGKHMKERL